MTVVQAEESADPSNNLRSADPVPSEAVPLQNYSTSDSFETFQTM